MPSELAHAERRRAWSLVPVAATLAVAAGGSGSSLGFALAAGSPDPA